MVELDKKYRSAGLSILAFPSDEFGGQELPSAEIQDFVTRRFGAQFTIFDKVKVNGPDAHPVWQYLKNATDKKDVSWNFAAKFLVSPDGATVKRYGKAIRPREMEADIVEMLSAVPKGGL